MDHRSLKAFLVLADTLHFAQAAQRSHMTPSALSRAVRRLEEEVGAVLFLRDNRSVVITPAGEEFRKFASETLVRWDSLQQRLHAEAEALAGELRLYCSVTASYGVLSALLPPFRSRFPGIEIQLHTGDQADAVERIATGEDDLAIAARPDQLPRKLSFQTLGFSPLKFIAPTIDCAISEVLRASNGELPWERLPVIQPDRGLVRSRLLQWFRRQGLKPAFYSLVSGHEALVSMVALGFGIGVVPEIVIQHSPFRDRIRILDVHPEMQAFEIGLCAQTARLDDALVLAFWRSARALSDAGK